MEAFKAKKINQFDYQNRLLFISNRAKVFFNYLIKSLLKKKISRETIYQTILREF